MIFNHLVYGYSIFLPESLIYMVYRRTRIGDMKKDMHIKFTSNIYNVDKLQTIKVIPKMYIDRSLPGNF